MMTYLEAVERTDVLDFVIKYDVQFPTLTGSFIDYQTLFKNWRFVETLDHEMVLANCIQPGITQEDILMFKSYKWRYKSEKQR